MVRYDSHQVQKFAQIMYRQALVTVVVWTLLGAVVGFAGSAALFWGTREAQGLGRDVGGPNTLVAIGTVLTGLIGLAIGQGKAFWYRLQAQILLCQSQIEANTRANAQYPDLR